MKLIDVYQRADRYDLLYRLLEQRESTVNISHRGMPPFDRHVKFVDKKPYRGWYFICDPDPVGACYVTHENEIGIFILKEYQGLGYGPRAVEMLMNLCGPRVYRANINPANERSVAMFAKMGFRPIQHTYELSTV